MTDTADKTTLKDIADKDADKAADKAAMKEAMDKTTGEPGVEPGVKAGDKPKSGGGFVWLVVVLAVMGGAVAAGWPFIGPRVTPVIADVRALMGIAPRPTQARLPSENMPVSEPAPVVETPAEPAPEPASEPMAEATPEPAQEAATPPDVVPGVSGVSGADMAGIASRLDALENQIGALGALSGANGQAALDATAELTRALSDMKNELAALSDRLQALEDGSHADPTAPAQALVLGVTQLRARLLGDNPFAAELTALEHIAAGDAVVIGVVNRLRPHADVGVPSEAALTARFAKVAKAIITARSTTEAGGWLGAVKDGLGGLVTVRRTDPAAITDEVERAVAEAEAALELGELAEAVKALSALQGAPSAAAAAWLGDASARVDAEAALEDLHSHALAVLSAAGGA